MMAEKFSHSFSQQQQKMRINEFKMGLRPRPRPVPQAPFWLNGGYARLRAEAVRSRPPANSQQPPAANRHYGRTPERQYAT